MEDSARSAFFQELAQKAASTPMLDVLFRDDPARAQRFVAEAAGLRIDFSKHWITDDQWSWLHQSLNALGFSDARHAFFAGDAINATEDRAVLHMALRADAGDPFAAKGVPIMDSVLHERKRCDQFADGIHQGTILGCTGSRITDVVNIGIGGSDLGPLMVCQALEPFRGDGPKTHFVSNVDPAHWASVYPALNPESTLLVIASKTFTTQETMENAKRAVAWLTSALGQRAVQDHVIALSSHVAAVKAWGIPENRMFPFWDWVGGRYSLWSSIGMSIRCQIGSTQFDQLLRGARAMDQHFLTAPAQSNLPVILALLGIWYRNGAELHTHAVIPYSQRLARLPAFLQQLEMESNGKQVNLAGDVLSWQTAPVIWGESGTNGQHAFHQLLHQGTDIIPVDFLFARHPIEGDPALHQLLIANCLAQSEALAFGDPQPNPHRRMPGNRPNTLIGFDRLDPFTLGALLALYEHKVFTQGFVWGINSFDQFGVELGKRLCSALAPAVRDPDIDTAEFSSSTSAWIEWIHQSASS